MKKLLTLLLALMMVLSLSACSKDAGNSNTAVSGTFEGESTGMQGPVKVSMTVEEGKITAVELTEIRLSPNIDTNDLNTKMNAAKKFLAKGNKVKITLRFRGREMAHMSSSKHILDDFAENLSDIAVVEKAPKIEGRSIGMVLAEKR